MSRIYRLQQAQKTLELRDISKLLRNEKDVGNVLLQKTYVKNLHSREQI